MSMVEIVARAIYPRMFAHSDYEDVPFDEAMSRPRYIFLKEQVIDAARAAILALREPTEQIAQAVGLYCEGSHYGLQAWRDGIDAALEGKE